MEERINTTIVTCLFYIGRDRWKFSGFPPGYDRYSGWMKNFLSLDAQMIFYVDEFYYERAVEIRKQYDPNLEKTVFIKTSLDQLEVYKTYYNRLSSLMNSPEFKKKIQFQVSDMLYPLYNVLMYNKANLLKQAAETNPFKSDYLYWVDVGAFREDLSEYENIKWPDFNNTAYFNNKITFFSHFGSEYNIDNQETHFLSQARVVQGGYFIVPVQKVDFLKEEVDSVINEILNKGYIGSDEKIFDIICKRNPGSVNMIKATWFEFYGLTKYKGIAVEAPVEEVPIVRGEGKNVFLDMGMHEQQGLGQFINILNIDPSWEVHCFEPNNLLSLQNRFTDLNVTIHNKAVWTHDGVIHLNLYGADRKSQGSIVVGSAGSDELIDLYDVIEIPCIDTFNFLSAFNSEDNVYIKMDIEWSEYDVLESLLAKGWPKNIRKIWVEWHGLGTGNCAERKEKIIEQIKSYNTEVENWY